MLLQIDPSTPKGQAQLEAIGWAQDQMNEVLMQYFENKVKVLKGLQFHFVLRTDLVMNERVKVEISHLPAKTEKEFDEGVKEFKATQVFQPEEKKKEVVT